MNKKLDNLITDISLIEDDNLKTKEIQKVLKALDSYEMDDYQLFYLKGCLWNSLPKESVKRDINVVDNLKKSIQLNENYIFSKTELSYFYFDKKEYSKVVELLSPLDFSFFEEKDQIWKSLKLKELLLVSKLGLVDKVDKKLTNDFFELISSYTFLPEEELAVPRELVDSIFNNKEKEGIRSIAKNVYQLVNSNNQKDYFDKEVRLNLKKIVNNGSVPN